MFALPMFERSMKQKIQATVKMGSNQISNFRRIRLSRAGSERMSLRATSSDSSITSLPVDVGVEDIMYGELVFSSRVWVRSEQFQMKKRARLS